MELRGPDDAPEKRLLMGFGVNNDARFARGLNRESASSDGLNIDISRRPLLLMNSSYNAVRKLRIHADRNLVCIGQAAFFSHYTIIIMILSSAI
jgi:hypothetical protein